MRFPTATTEPITAWDAGAVAKFAAGTDDVLMPIRRPLDHLEAAVQACSVHNSTVPVTVSTGSLGSDKTTLLNRILAENHGKLTVGQQDGNVANSEVQSSAKGRS